LTKLRPGILLENITFAQVVKILDSFYDRGAETLDARTSRLIHFAFLRLKFSYLSLISPKYYVTRR